MHWASTISLSGELEIAARALEESLPAPPDLVLAFCSPNFNPRLAQVHERLPSARVIGCTAGGVVGGGREVEREPALSLVAACLPDVGVIPFHVAPGERPTPAGWATRLGITPDHEPSLILLPDPLTTPSEELLRSAGRAFPGRPVIGGLASGGRRPGEHALVIDGALHAEGAVGVALYGDVAMDTAVAQGCRPVGPTIEVTRAQGPVAIDLGGAPAAQALDGVFGDLSAEDQALFRRAPLVGLVMDPALESPLPGDFLVRNIRRVDRASGAIVLPAALRPGQLLRFHVRDAHAAANDLRAVLGRYGARGHAPAGALLFSCLGRGRGLFGRPDFETGVFHEIVGDTPLGGFFCNGEIGPVASRTWLHTYTSSFGIFRSRGWN